MLVVSEIWIYAQHLAYCREIRQLQRVSMTTAAAVMVVGTTGDGTFTSLNLKGTSRVPTPYLMWLFAERERK